jgi:Cdc6-like AAA superfamily ATPase
VPPLPQTLPTKRIEVLQFNAMAYSQCFPLLLEIVAQIFERAELPFNKTVYKNGTYLLEMFKMHIEKFQNKIVFLLLIDELDTLAKHDQKNFELINDLLNMKDTCLVKIGISNTLDLFAKYKGTKQYVECKQMAFKPYGDEDLWGILKERMEGVNFHLF